MIAVMECTLGSGSSLLSSLRRSHDVEVNRSERINSVAPVPSAADLTAMSSIYEVKVQFTAWL